MFEYENLKGCVKPYIIAELGSNHNGDMELAKNMIAKAKECGADCIKLQSWTKDVLFSRKVYEDNYFLKDDYRNRTDYTLEEIVEKFSIDQEDHYCLWKYCKEIGIDFNSTPFNEEETDLLVDELDVPFIKIASMDLNNLPFLRYEAKKGKPVVLSTGLCGLSDINDAVLCLEENGCHQIILLHCVSIYPPKDDQVNLNNMDMLRDNFGYPVGYSDHTFGTVAPILSVAKGACVIEKHFTLDKEMFGWDHKISADPRELKEIVNQVSIAYKMLGSYRRIVNESQERKDAFQRSIIAAKEIKKGQVIKKEDLTFKRPGTGIPPKYVDFIIGKEAKRDIPYDSIVKMEDF